MPNGSDGNGPNVGWQVLEEESFETALAQFQDTRAIDNALASIMLGLNRNPTAWPSVPGFAQVHLAKTKLHLEGADVVPSYLVWFRADDEKREVHLLWVEITPPDNFGFPDGEDNFGIAF